MGRDALINCFQDFINAHAKKHNWPSSKWDYTEWEEVTEAWNRYCERYLNNYKRLDKS